MRLRCIVALGLVGGLVTLSGGVAVADNPKVTAQVTPSTGLSTEGTTTVSVTAQGYGPNLPVSILECKQTTPDIQDCSFNEAGSGSTDGNGNLSATDVVVSADFAIDGGEPPTMAHCLPEDNCLLFMLGLGPGGGPVSYALHFAGAPGTVQSSLVVADFNGDFKTEPSVFRQSAGQWYASSGTALNYGASGDVAVPGDYDGDNLTDVAIFRPTTGLWAIHKSSGGDTFVTYGGIDGDVPVPADYDGDRKVDITIYRPSTGTWFVHKSSGGDTATTFGGVPGDIPVPADYDGDRTTDLAIFRSGTWHLHQTSAGDTAVNWGTAGDIPIVGDYDLDFRADPAIFRPSTGLFALHTVGSGDLALTYGGVPGDVPVPGDYDSDGKTDVAIFRPAFGTWFVHKSTGGDSIATFGIPTDTPLPLPYAVYNTFF